MKYMIIFILLLLLLIPFDMMFRQVHAQTIMVANTFSNSQINQYIFINCETEECQAIVETLIKEGVEVVAGIEEVEGVEEVELSFVEATEGEVGEGVEGTKGISETSGEEEIANSVEDNTEETVDNLDSFQPVIEPKAIRINEIMSVPLSGDKEWVELFNTLSVPVDLKGWQLIEGAEKKTELFGIIQAKEYLIFDRSGLNNGGDIVILKDSQGKIIDSVAYGDWDDGNIDDNAPKTSSGKSLILFENKYQETEISTPGKENVLKIIIQEENSSKDTENQTNETAQEQTTSENNNEEEQIEKAEQLEPAEQNQEPSYDFSNQVRINEFLANPEGSDDAEWIELYNADEKDVNLFGWTLDDSEGGSKLYLIEEDIIIKSKDYLVFDKEKTGLVLNNSTDQIVLRDPNGKIISQTSYQNPKEGSSFAYFENSWQETTILTPGKENEKSSLQIAQFEAGKEKADKFKDVYYQTLDITEAKKQPLKTKVKIQGKVVVLPNVFGKQIIYLVGSGIQVYFNSAEWPDLQIGDIVEIAGTISESRGEKRILVKNKEDIQILGNEELQEPHLIMSADIGENLEGYFVQIQGQLLEKQTSKLIFADENGEFTVYLKKGAGIDSKLLEVGDRLKIAGILSQVDDNYYIMPRSQDDLENLTWQEKEVLGASLIGETNLPANQQQRKTVWILLAAFAALCLTNLYFFIRKKLLIRKIEAPFCETK